MAGEDHLIIVGASARAAAFSALRAGLRPWCADLFADADLAARCPARQVASREYPGGFVKAFREAPPGPWMYTGGLENHPVLVRELTRLRPLWGVGALSLAKVREPMVLSASFNAAGVPHPEVRRASSRLPKRRRWLRKPVAGAGGRGIEFFDPRQPRRAGRGRWYYQEFVEGEPCAAVYVGQSGKSRLLGVTRQLVGEAWLNAAPFHYCGSVGPLSLSGELERSFRLIGGALVAGFRLRGLFGVDCVVRDNAAYPVEVNPRYTASVEVLEYATGMPLLAQHRAAFVEGAVPDQRGPSGHGVVGKAVVFAAESFTLPAKGPWSKTLRKAGDVWALPDFADIPPAGSGIKKGWPVLTVLSRGPDTAACVAALKERAAALGPFFK